MTDQLKCLQILYIYTCLFLSIIDIVDRYVSPYCSVQFFLNYLEDELLDTYKFNILDLSGKLNTF